MKSLWLGLLVGLLLFLTGCPKPLPIPWMP